MKPPSQPQRPPPNAVSSPTLATGWLGAWRWLPLGLVVALGFVLGYREIASPDIGFHLASGRWIMEHGTVPRLDPFSFTASDRPYVDLQWLFQLMLYGSHALGGASMVLGLKLGLVGGFWALLLARTRQRWGHLPAAAAGLLMLVALGDLWEERPHLMSWVYGSALLWIVERHASSGERRFLPALPVILLLWVNTHSLFVLGLVIIGTYAFWDAWRRGWRGNQFLLWAMVAGAVCIVNPYHIQGLMLPVLQFTEIQAGSAFKSPLTGLGEFQNPFGPGQYWREGRLVLLQPCLYWQLYTLLAVIGHAALWRQLRPAERTLGLLFLFAFWSANKNFGYFVMATFPITVGGCAQVIQRLGTRQRQLTVARLEKAQSLAITLISGAALALAASGWLYAQEWTPHRFGAGFNRALLPVGACEFIRDHRMSGRVLCGFGTGGYIHWVTRQPVSIYGIAEVFREDLYSEYIGAKAPERFPAYLDKLRPDLAVVTFADTPFWLYHLNSRPDWQLVHHDEFTALFARTNSGNRRLRPPEAGTDFRKFSDAEIRQILDQASRRPRSGFRVWLRGTTALPLREMRLSSFYLHTGQLLPCISLALEGCDRSPVLVPELFLNLGHSFQMLGHHELSRQCFRVVREHAPDLLAPETPPQR